MSETIQFIKNNSTLKLVIILFLILIMLIPLSMVEDLIHERTSMRQNAQNKIAQSWGGTQTLSGPVLKIPYKTKVIEKKLLQNGQEQKVQRYELHHLFLLSEKLSIQTKMESETRYLGIYDMPVYLSQSSLVASFNSEELKKLDEQYELINWQNAQLIIPFSDVRGIRQIDGYLKQSDNEHILHFKPYNDSNFLNGFLNGIVAKIPPLFDNSIKNESNVKKSESQTISVSVKLSLAGSQSLLFRPFGRLTNIEMVSDWNSPGFYGEFLPAQREITQDGFNASWQILELNRNFPQQWIDNRINEQDILKTVFGVKLIQPVDLYQQNKRSIKYAVLFIGLTFMTFFLMEILYKNKLHPIQYFFTGGALSTFYLLLIAFSEHTGFNQAYLIATLSISLLMAGYSVSILHNCLQGIIAGTLCLILYGFFYILIQSEENALLLGAIVFFLILTALMYTTRNINWYQTETALFKT